MGLANDNLDLLAMFLTDAIKNNIPEIKRDLSPTVQVYRSGDGKINIEFVSNDSKNKMDFNPKTKLYKFFEGETKKDIDNVERAIREAVLKWCMITKKTVRSLNKGF